MSDRAKFVSSRPDSASRYGTTLAVILPFAVLAGVLAWFSDGVYQDDDLSHVQIARWAWSDPLWLLDVWGRPGFTVPYALVANLGRFATGFFMCRLLSVVIAGLSAWLAALCAKRVGLKHPAWAALALVLMPLYFQLSYTTLTETVCGLYLILGTYLLLAERPRWAAAVLALAPLARLEAIIVFAPVGLYLLWRREWLAILLLLWASVLWNVLSGLWMWSLPISSYVAPRRDDYYGYGGWLHYLMQWAEVVTPAGVGLVLAGAGTWYRLPPTPRPSREGWGEAVLRPALLGRGEGEGISPASDHSTSLYPLPTLSLKGRGITASWLIPVGALGSVAVHTWIYHNSPFAGGGYPRFLIPACPWMAICAAWALEQLLAKAKVETPKSRNAETSALPKSSDHPIIRSPDSKIDHRQSTMVIPLLILLGVLGSFGAVYSYATRNADGVLQWPWWGQQVLALWLVTPAIVLTTLLVLLLRRRWCVWTLTFTLTVSVGWNWVWRAAPHKLLPQQAIMARAVDFVRQSDPSGQRRTIIAYSPWVAYFDEQRHPVRCPQPDKKWSQGSAGLVFIHDSEHSAREFSVQKLTQSPHRLLLQLNLNNPWYHDPYVQVFERLADRPTSGSSTTESPP